MEVKRPHIKSMKFEDFKDNEYIDQLIAQLNAGGVNVVVGKLDELLNWSRSNSLWPFCFGTSCCAIEFMCLGAARYDMARFGAEVARNSPRQADYIMCQGTINYRMAPALKRLYEQMAEPKYVIACGSCTVSGGPFKNSYCVVKGVDVLHQFQNQSVCVFLFFCGSNSIKPSLGDGLELRAAGRRGD